MLLMLGFAATLSTVNLLYHVPRAERMAQENAGRQFAQEISRLQSTLEYLLLKGELVGAEDVPSILADADQLHQVMLNLIINAQQALQEHPAPRRIVLASRYDRTREVIRITVVDNGPGIPANIIGRIFEPYFTTKASGTGLGAGLAVSLGIIEAHDGTLTVECPGNAGTLFTIELPAISPELQRYDADIAAEEHTRQLSILVIDDEESIRETLAEILESEAHQVTLAASGHEALERIDASPFDVILSDIRMPDMGGFALYEAIQGRWPDQSARVIFVTGDTLTPSLSQWAGQRGCPVIEKPFLPSEVRRFVAERASGRRMLSVN